MILLIWSLLELVFYLYAQYKKKQFQKYIRPHKVPTAEERKKLYWNSLQSVRHDVKSWLAGWFYINESRTHEAPSFDEIYRDNVATWLAWAFWVDPLDVVRKNDTWAAELEWMISAMEQRYSIRFTEGYNHQIRCIRPNFDPVQSLHRPLLLYVGSYVLALLFNLFFLEHFWKFERRGTDAPGVMFGHILRPFYNTPPPTTTMEKNKPMFKHLVYWHRPASTRSTTTASPPQTPIVFIHGIGGGVTFYGEFVHQLIQTSGHRPIFCIELPYASMRLVEHIPSPEETVAEIEQMLDIHGHQKATIVAHSLGTAVASWIANLAPERVGGMVLVDPICFLLNYHHVAYNMLCRVPQTFFEHLTQYCVSRELYVSYYISRHFQWYKTILFPLNTPIHDPPVTEHGQRSRDTLDAPLRNAAVYLSERDPLVDSHAIVKYLNASGVHTRMMKKVGHAEFLVRGSWKREILSQIEKAACVADEEGLALFF